MAKIIKIGFTDETVGSKDYELLCKYLEKKGFQYIIKDVEIEQKAEKKAEKKPAKKTSTKKAETKKPSEKSGDNFDVELYREVARKLGVLGKKGVWKFARQTVYDGMHEVENSKNGKMSAKVFKSLQAQLLTEAQRLGLQWYIDQVAEDKKAAK